MKALSFSDSVAANWAIPFTLNGGFITFSASTIFFDPYPQPTLKEANPNNPTATYLTKKEILELRNKMNKNIHKC